MEIKHPEMEYIPVKVKKAKLDSDGSIVYVDENRKLPRMVFDAMVDEKINNDSTNSPNGDAE